MHTIRIALVAGALVALAACGKKDNDKPSSPPAPAVAEAAASKAPSPPDAAPAAPKKAADAAAAVTPPDAAAVQAAAVDAAPVKAEVKKNSGPTKKLKVLSKKWSRKKVNGYMKKSMNKGLGVKCAFCHEKDDHAANTKHKKIALDMLKMTKDINRRFFKGKPEVTCYTCHLGSEEPPK